jgi:energy-coupling factor transporter ATP-binding protein EcfA2
MMNLKRQTAALKAIGRVENLKGDLTALRSHLEQAPLWMPGRGLGRQCDEAVQLINRIAARFERNLVVTLIGPSGSGKSTLLNALAGIDHLSAAGHRRPTTADLIIFSRHSEDAAQLASDIGGAGTEIRSSESREFPESICLVDTPDTDSNAFPAHRHLVEQAVAHADMLICVFDAENPKRRDHVDFLAPLVKRFDGESLVTVLNKCDRLDEAELKKQILPDFVSFLKKSWDGTVCETVCISARRHLHRPEWDEGAGPKHDFDEFPRLRRMLHDEIHHAGFIVDRRLENVRRLHRLVADETTRELAADRGSLTAASQALQAAEKSALGGAISALQADDGRYLAGIGVMLYHRLSQRWLGPIGWLVAIWTRLLILGAGVVSMFRFGRPVHQVMGMLSTWRHLRESKTSRSERHVNERLGAAVRSYRVSLLKEWPSIAALMIRGRFEGGVRRMEATLADADVIEQELSELWSAAVESQVDRVVRRLSGFFLQLVFNAPSVGILGYIGYVTVLNFFERNYLSGNFFMHAFWVLAIVLLLSFFLLQVVVRLSGGAERLAGKAFQALKRDLDQVEGFIETPVKAQLAAILQLVDIAASEARPPDP